jgi:hypothetical protein
MEQGRGRASGWAGWSALAAIFMIVSGSMHVLTGVSAIARDEVYAYTPGHVVTLDVATWGWVYLILGIVVGVSGLFVFTGAVWARAVAVAAIVASMVTNFASLPYQPGWSIAMLMVGSLVIYALTVHGRDIAA